MINAGVRPGGRSTFLSGKVDKTIDAQSGLFDGTDAGWRAVQLAPLKQGPQADKSVRSQGRMADVGVE